MKGEYFRPCPKCGRLCSNELDMCEICSGKIAKTEPKQSVVSVAEPETAPTVEETVAEETVVEGVAAEETTVQKGTVATEYKPVVEEIKTEDTVNREIVAETEVKEEKTPNNIGRKAFYAIVAVSSIALISLVVLARLEQAKPAITEYDNILNTRQKRTETTTEHTKKETTTKKETAITQYIETTTKKRIETTTEKYVETTTKNQTNNINSKIHTENSRHEKAIQEINQKYDSDIAYYQTEVDRLHSIVGYASSYSYSSQINQLTNEMMEKERKLNFLKMDTSGANKSKIRSLESELEQDNAELNELLTRQTYAQMAEEYEAQVNALKSEKQDALYKENELHETNLEEIYASV